VSGDAVALPQPGVPGGGPMVGPLDNRFHVVSVACLRVIQIRNGGRPRLDPAGHKPCVAAVAEVVAGAVPYFFS
jgi:DNA-directed RNA polymerase subunit K/omega